MENTNIERPNTVAGLLEKRAQLAGKLKYLRAEERKVICDLDHIDAAIRLFNAKPNEDRIVRFPTKHRAKKGEVVRLVVRLLGDVALGISLGIYNFARRHRSVPRHPCWRSRFDITTILQRVPSAI